MRGASYADPVAHKIFATKQNVKVNLILKSSVELALDKLNLHLTLNERRVAQDRRDCYWLYVVTDCKSKSQLQEPIKDPARFPWHEACLPRRPDLRRRQVKKVDHYYLSVDALTQPMQVREDSPPYGTRDQ